MKLEDTTKCYYQHKAREYFLATYKLDVQHLWSKLDGRLRAHSLLLDLGCGSGRDMRYFSAKGHRVIGLDFSLEMLQLAKSYTGLPVVCADFSAIPFKDSVFDAAWALGSLLHIKSCTLPRVLAEIHRVLKAGALLFTAMKEGCGEEVDERGRYNRYYSAEEWKEVLKRNQFEQLESEIVSEGRESSQGRQIKVNWISCVSMST